MLIVKRDIIEYFSKLNLITLLRALFDILSSMILKLLINNKMVRILEENKLRLF